MESQEQKKGPIVPLVVVGVVAALAAGYYYWSTHNDKAVPVSATPTAPSAEPAIRHPVPRSETQATKPLPALAESDDAMRDAAGGLIGLDALTKFFNTDSIARRFVATVDDLPRQKLPQRYNLAKPVSGVFLIDGKGDNIALSPDNYKRYSPYVTLVESLDTKKLIATYAYFYPLLQEEYRNLGQPKKYFNDRLVDAIDDMLAAPEVKEPLKLVQPKVMYMFADPTLESRSAGQKLMIRMGPENAVRVKAKLREIRAELTRR